MNPVENFQNPFAVQVRNVTKAFGTGDARTHALKGVNFDTRLGELLLIVGPSGCGKTTLLSIIAGTMQFDSGEIEVFENRLHTMNKPAITDFRRRDIGFIFQQFNLIPTLSCLENISVPLLLNGVSRRDAEARSREAMKLVGLESKTREQPTNLSGGQQQRVAIARALVHEPRLIICDEPTSALDKDTGAKIMELLHDVAKAPNRSVIVVTHDTRIFRYADRMTEMEDGRVQRVHESYTDYTHEQET